MRDVRGLWAVWPSEDFSGKQCPSMADFDGHFWVKVSNHKSFNINSTKEDKQTSLHIHTYTHTQTHTHTYLHTSKTHTHIFIHIKNTHTHIYTVHTSHTHTHIHTHPNTDLEPKYIGVIHDHGQLPSPWSSGSEKNVIIKLGFKFLDLKKFEDKLYLKFLINSLI